MKKDFSILERFRLGQGEWATKEGERFGLFLFTRGRLTLQCIACDAIPEEEVHWEHVSVVAKYRNKDGKVTERTPTWDEMVFIKDAFWSPEETVMQLHVPKADWINNHPHCLHLWKPANQEIPLPPSSYVGIKEGKEAA